MVRPKVYIQGSFANRSHRQIFREHNWEIVEDAIESDAVCWTGGEDISPAMYGELPLPSVYTNVRRDTDDVRVFQAVVREKFLIGTCRGAQLLNVLNGGTLWQDIDGHGNTVHPVKDVTTDSTVLVNSLHHQGIILTKQAETLAYCRQSRHKTSDGREWRQDSLCNSEDMVDVEAFWYPETMSLGVQFHPEFGHASSRDYFFELIDRYYDYS